MSACATTLTIGDSTLTYRKSSHYMFYKQVNKGVIIALHTRVIVWRDESFLVLFV